MSQELVMIDEVTGLSTSENGRFVELPLATLVDKHFSHGPTDRYDRAKRRLILGPPAEFWQRERHPLYCVSAQKRPPHRSSDGLVWYRSPLSVPDAAEQYSIYEKAGEVVVGITHMPRVKVGVGASLLVRTLGRKKRGRIAPQSEFSINSADREKLGRIELMNCGLYCEGESLRFFLQGEGAAEAAYKLLFHQRHKHFDEF